MLLKQYRRTKGIIFAAFFMAGIIRVSAQTDPMVMIIGNDSIKLSEFKSNYLKNNDLQTTTEESLKNYINLYVNYRLKCNEAKSLKMDTIQRLKEELQGYRRQAAAAYLTEKSVNNNLISEAIENSKWDIRAWHIMKKLPLEPQPKDTLEAYNALMQIRNRLMKGEDFAQMAVSESDDPSARPQFKDGKMVRAGNKGDLGYFTVFSMVYEFEKAAYNTKVGEISMPVRSNFGYHLIYVQDKQPAVSSFNTQQILIAYPKNATANDSAATLKKVQEAYEALLKGMSFEEAVEKYCTDEGLRQRKGEMDKFNSGRFEGDFVAPLYHASLGEVIKPFATRYGWHILKLVEKEPVVIDENSQGIIKMRIARDSRSNLGPEAMVARLKKEYNFTEIKPKNKKQSSPVEDFYKIDSVKVFNGNWKAEEFKGDKVMFTFADQKRTQKDFAANIEKNQFKGMRNVTMKELINYAYGRFVYHTIYNYENDRLESKYPDFQELMNEYKNGIMLYELNNEKIWKKSETDTVGLQNFYEQIKDEFLYPVRAHAITYSLNNEKAYKLFTKMMNKGLTLEAIDAKFHKKGWIISARETLYARGENKEFDQICPWDILMQEGNLVLEKEETKQYITIEKVNPTPKPLSSIRGIVISRYQNKLEDEWVKEMHQNTRIWIDEQKILSLIKK